MSTVARTTIGFDRSIDIEWLDAVAARVARGESPEAIRKFLWDFLEDVVPGNTHSSGRGKTLTVLTRIWLVVPEQTEPLRIAALRSIVSATGEQRIAIHWAMVIGTHPFFCDVAANVGKLLTLNGQANRSQIKRRMTEAWGDRSTLERTIQQVLRSMVQWGLLRLGQGKGSLLAPLRRIPVNDEVSELLLHAVLLGHGHGLPLSQLTGHPALFPFDVHLNAATLRKSSSMLVQRQGDQADFVELGQRSRSSPAEVYSK
jgi:hypothetical protein